MTGPEHYREADKLLKEASEASPNADRADVALILRFAEVHAILAVADAILHLRSVI